MGLKLGWLCPFGGNWSNTMFTGQRPTSLPSGILIHPAVSPQQTWAKNLAGCVPLSGGLGPHLTQCGLDQGLAPYHLDPSSSLATTDMGRKLAGLCPILGELGPHLTQCGRRRGLPPRQVSSWSIQPFGHNTPTSQTERTDRQPGQTTVWWHRANRFTNNHPKTALLLYYVHWSTGKKKFKTDKLNCNPLILVITVTKCPQSNNSLHYCLIH